jgi:hypothetical protein
MYDIFFVSNGECDSNAWTRFKQKFSNAQKIENCKSFEQVASKSLTKHFWVVWDNLELAQDFQLDYRVPEWDAEYVFFLKKHAYYNVSGITDSLQVKKK